MAQQFWNNQFASIYDTFFQVFAPRLQQAWDQHDPRFQGMHDELDRAGRDLYLSIGSQIIQHQTPPLQYFPEFAEVYQTLRDMRTQLAQAQAHQDPLYQAMRNELMDREDTLEMFVREQFLKEYLERGNPLQMGGRKRKSKRKSKTRRNITRRR
jgi:hypothetical protein